MVILVTNDDGIQAPALRQLKSALADLGRVVIVAPDRDQSATSHALTLYRPFRIERPEPDVYAVDGTPTDCVVVATHGLIDVAPTLVVSGVNHGPNMGEDVFYSGTVAAAIEGALNGLPSVAVSLVARRSDEVDWTEPARVTRSLVDAVLHHGLAPKSLLNVNLPWRGGAAYEGMRVTKLGQRVYQDSLITKTDPRGRPYYWIGGDEPVWLDEEETDFLAVSEGYVSVTPLMLDLTHHQARAEMRKWRLSI
ncbi:MAG TPA: 5'/3'-nucleotidase SurE [Candidatus Eisenbacteria bacterium]|jgi:5'/3'-nucleotidase|nr:5'/3'-nucleotidase SurE [Candidatus Eisenbacteria bacterium]